jgi:hypothetical protein
LTRRTGLWAESTGIQPPALDLGLELQPPLLVESGDVHLGVEDLDLRIGGDLGGAHLAAGGVDRHDLRVFAVQPDGDLFQVEDDVGDVLDHPGNRGEFVQHPLDVDRGDRGAFDRRQQAAPESVADGRRKTPLERLRSKAPVSRGESFRIDFNALGALKAFPKHSGSSVFRGSPALTAVQLDDQLLLHRQLDVFA